MRAADAAIYNNKKTATRKDRKKKVVIHHFNRIIKNKWVWGVFAVLISMFFAFDFIFDGRRDARGGSDGAGKLGGETVPTATFDEVRADVLAEMRFQYGREIPIKAPQLNREVWSRLAMLKVVDDLKLTAGDDEVREAITRSFQDEKGVYSAARFQETCARVGWTPERFEAYIRRQISIGRVRSTAESASWVSPLEFSSSVRDATDKITVRIARFQHKNAASVKLDDAALKAYYESHTNSLALPDLTAVRYVRVPADDAESLKKVTITDDDLHERYDETSDRYGTNEFEKVKAQVERELRLERAVEAACDALYARVCPDGGAADEAVDQLDKLARAEKLEVKTSRQFSISGEKFVPGFSEAFFRNAESGVLMELVGKPPCVVSTGGGLPTVQENVQLMQNLGIIIHVDRPLDQILSDIKMERRPTLIGGSHENVIDQYNERIGYYRACADYRLDNSHGFAVGLQTLTQMIESLK